MQFGEEDFRTILPSYLTDEAKGRLQSGLSQFHPANRNEITYDEFYKDFGYKYFLQGDIITDVRMAFWDDDTKEYQKTYTEGIILSNTCDLSLENNRNVNPKQCIFAPLIILDDYLKELSDNGCSQDRIEQTQKNIRSQYCSNIFYLPSIGQGQPERIALLDQIFWYPIQDLADLIDSINEERVMSLDQLGFYLLAVKISYHFCRLPEQCDRAA